MNRGSLLSPISPLVIRKCQIQNDIRRMSASETTTTATGASMEDTASSSTSNITSSMRSPMQSKECNFSTHDEDGAAENLFPALFEWSQAGSTIGITGSFNKYVCVCVHMCILRVCMWCISYS